MSEIAKAGGIARRNFFQLAGGAIGAVSAGGLASGRAVAAPEGLSETPAAITPMPPPSGDMNTSDILVETLIAWGAPFVFGIVGDGINPIIEALRERQDRIRYIGVRHEEAAAFMACGIAKHTGRLGVCLGTTGPGAVHLLNGLYDAHLDGAPVLAITGMTFHDLIGTRFQQGIDTIPLMQQVTLYNVEVTSPGHALVVANRACRTALGDRGVAHLTIAKDVQGMKLSGDKPSMENHGVRTSSVWTPIETTPGADQLRAAADLLNGGTRVAILAGQGALNARQEVEGVADLLGAPVPRALLGRAVLPDDSPFSTGGIGHLGTEPSEWAMHNCDTLLILGSTMPWIDSYPRPGAARAVQIDLKADRIGLRYPVEIGLVGDVKATLAALTPMLQHKEDRTFLSATQGRMQTWNSLLDRIESTQSTPLRPQMVIRALSDALADDAVISLDCGANTHFSARHLRLRAGQRLTGTGMLASMGPGLSYAIAARLAFPERQSVTIVGDGGFAQLMAELATAVQYDLPVKILLMKNNSLAEVKFEQMDIGNQEFGCTLSPIDFAAYAKACGADGFRCEHPDEVRPAIQAMLASPRPALLEAVVDANEPPLKPNQLRA